MAQIKRFSWTNASSAVARNLDVGFTTAKIEIWDTTTPNRFEWMANMADASYFTLGTLAFTTTNGVTPLAQSSAYGATISAFTNANPGVITVNDTATFGFAAGDTIKVADVADDLTGTLSLNNTFVIASLTATTITLVENTTVTAYSVWVSGGVVTRVTDTTGAAIVLENLAIRGLTLGTGAVGANSAVMTAICYGEESVV
ncbi:MAG: hypothetical protein K1000chlam2_00016 [Chlamydiae bacterium]|nr:hypothetical protein [Chlamydiota bacterium]